MDAIRELKIRAEILHRRIQTNDRRAVGRLRVLPQFRRASHERLAAELVVGPGADFGTMLYPGHRCAGHINRWYKTYEEATADRAASGGYLLAYQRQFVVVDRYFIESLGLDPSDPDWETLGFDWVRPKSLAARSRLYAKLVACLPREAV
jgi:hypothetical protein